MRYLFTVHTYYPDKNGVQAVTGYLAEGLVRKGHEVIVIAPFNTSDVSDEPHNGVDIKRVNVKTKHARYSGDIKEYIKLVQRYSEKADVMINVCTQNSLTDTLLPYLKNIKCKKILYVHGMINFSFKGNRIDSPLELAHKIWNNVRWGIYYNTTFKKYVNQYDEIIQLHRFDDAYLYFEKKYGIKSNVIENAADDVFFEELDKNNLELPDRYAICVSNYMKRKNQEFVIRAFHYATIPEDYQLILIGSKKNHYYEYLTKLNEELSEKSGKKAVILTDVPRELTSSYVKHASVYLMGSIWEAFPISLIETMAAGVPFISTDVGCVKYLPGGIVIDSVEGMSYWLELLCNNESTRIAIGNAGKEYAGKNLSIDVKVGQLEKIASEGSANGDKVE